MALGSTVQVETEMKLEMRGSPITSQRDLEQGHPKGNTFICRESEDDLYELVEEGSVQVSSDDDCGDVGTAGCGDINAGATRDDDADLPALLTLGAAVERKGTGELTQSSREVDTLSASSSGADVVYGVERSFCPTGSFGMHSQRGKEFAALAVHGAALAGGDGIQDVLDHASSGWQDAFEHEVALVKLKCEQDLLQVPSRTSCFCSCVGW